MIALLVGTLCGLWGALWERPHVAHKLLAHHANFNFEADTPSARHGRNDLNCHGYLQRCVPCPTFGPSSGVSLTPAIRNAR